MNVNPAEASNYIINPLAGSKAAFTSMFSTHPPTDERIRRLRAVTPAV
jgi:heat shock protein HtpX